jgi:hypothetical protein
MTIPRPVLHFLGNVPNVIIHYHDHNEQEPTSFLAFLKEHMPGSSHLNTDSKHKNLPWGDKTIVEHSQLQLMISPQHALTLSSKYIEHKSIAKPLAKQQSYEFQYLHSIWQPPKHLIS